MEQARRTRARQVSRYAMVAGAVGLIVLGAACGTSRDTRQGEETVPRIPPTSAPPTTAAPTEPPTTAAPTDPPTTALPATNPPTAPPAPTPWPTSATVPPAPPPTQPPATQPAPPTQPPATQPAPPTQPPATQPAPPTQPPPTQLPPTQPPATQPPAPTTPAPTSTVVVGPSTPPLCDAATIGTDTGLLTLAGVRCNAGWAIDATCPASQECEGVDVFHISSAGWVHDGFFAAVCAEGLTDSGMSIYTAATFVPTYCAGAPGPTEVIRPDSTGDRVVQLQTALIGNGYPIAADGTYGPRTQAAVRDFQSRYGLEVDGIAGPQTQAALGIGPGATAPTSPSAPETTTTVDGAGPTSSVPAPTSRSAPETTTTVVATGPTSSVPAPTTTVLGAGQPAECTAAAIGPDIGREVDEITACHSGWALGQIKSCPANSACPKADLFHVTDAGWVHDGPVSYQCAEDLHEAGMSAYTAGDFTQWCGVPNLPDERLVIDPGSTGEVVTQLQIALVALGFPIAIDGTYGPGTEQAIRDFQTHHELEVDGIAGPRTRELLGL